MDHRLSPLHRLEAGWMMLSLPLVFLVIALRLVTLPWFPAVTYALPSFPPDQYGLTQPQRVALARVCIADLNIPQGPQMLREARLPNGAIAFTESEVAHMDDVRRLYDALTRLALLFAVVDGLIAALLWRREGRAVVGRSLARGGLLTLSMLPLLGVLMLLDWDRFFIGLHELFFTPGTWRFAYESTLIRLFPDRFWQLAAATVIVLWMAFGGIALLLGRGLQRH